MYGYIRAYKPEMRFREYDIYHVTAVCAMRSTSGTAQLHAGR